MRWNGDRMSKTLVSLVGRRHVCAVDRLDGIYLFVSLDRRAAIYKQINSSYLRLCSRDCHN